MRRCDARTSVQVCSASSVEAFISAVYVAELTPPADWLDAYLLASQAAMPNFTARQLAVVHMALTRMGCR